MAPLKNGLWLWKEAERQVIKNFARRCWASSAIRERIGRIHVIPARMGETVNQIATSKCWWGCGEGKCALTAGGIESWCSHAGILCF